MFENFKPSILIIDDNRSILKSFSKIFQKCGYRVSVAETGSEAIQRISENHFDVALIDFRLPDMEGTELVPLINKAYCRTLKVMLSAECLQKVEGVDLLIGKPVDPIKLLSVIDSKLRYMTIE